MKGGRERINPSPRRVVLRSVSLVVSVRVFRSVCSSVSKSLSVKTAILYIVLGTISNDYLDQSVGRLVYLCDLSRRFASRGLPKHNYLELESI